MISGTVYGVVLNDSNEIAQLSQAFAEAPYKAAPSAPVVHIKPRTCVSLYGAPVGLEVDVQEVALGTTIALLFGRDATRVSPDTALDTVDAACLAVDVTVPHASYYRPALAERCRDGFLPLGAMRAPPTGPIEIVTTIDGRVVHRWSLDRLVRPIARLIADLSDFMTLRAGDLLLVGVPGDAPVVRRGQSIGVAATGFAPLAFRVEDAS